MKIGHMVQDNKLAPRMKVILRTLKAAGKGMTIRQIAEETQYAYRTIAPAIAFLHERGHVRRTYAARNGYIYRFVSFPVGSFADSAEPLNANTVFQLLNKMASDDFEPMPKKDKLTYVCQQLIKTAHAITVGEKGSDLGELRNQLNEVAQSINMLHTAIIRLLATEEVWTPEELGAIFSERLQ